MIPPTFLELFHEGEWHRIGWDAYTPESAQALRQHGDRLAAHAPDESYRLTQQGIGLGAPPVVIHEWNAVVA